MAMKRGFTLIEIMVTIGVLGMLFAAATGLFFRVFRTGGQTGSVIDIEKNAQATLNVIDRFIKNAKSVDTSCPGSGGTLTLTNTDGYQTTFTTVTDGNEVARVASNGAYISSPEVNVDDLNFVCSQSGGPEQVDVSITFSYVSTGVAVTGSQTHTLKSGLRTY